MSYKRIWVPSYSLQFTVFRQIDTHKIDKFDFMVACVAILEISPSFVHLGHLGILPRLKLTVMQLGNSNRLVLVNLDILLATCCTILVMQYDH